MYINYDTGAYGGFNSGDCDNSTDAKANSGYYVDGTVNQVAISGQNQVLGYSSSSGDGQFNSFAGSSSAGPAAAYLNPYTNDVTAPGQSVNVNANNPLRPSTTPINISSQIHADGVRPRLPQMTAYHPPTPVGPLTGDPSCFGAPDAVSDIHNLQRGNAQGSPQASTDGQFGDSTWQRTTQGDRPFGNGAADTGFNAGFIIGETGC